VLRSILIDNSKQNWRISEDCKDLTVPKGVDGCEVEIDAHVKGNVTIDGNNCTLKLLNGAEFGQKSPNSSVAINNSFNGNVSFNGHVSAHTVVIGDISGGDVNIHGGTVTINGAVIRGSRRVVINGDVYDITSHEDGVVDDSTGTTFYINGTHAHIVAVGSKWSKKGLNASVIVTGDHAYIEPDISKSVIVEGDDCTMGGSIKREARVSGHRCRIKGSIHRDVKVFGDDCLIGGDVKREVYVEGDRCNIKGNVSRSARVRQDTQIGGRVGRQITRS
jgi:hypothetical protein